MKEETKPALSLLFSKMKVPVSDLETSLLPDTILRTVPLTPREQTIEALFKQAQENPQGNKDDLLLVQLECCFNLELLPKCLSSKSSSLRF